MRLGVAGADVAHAERVGDGIGDAGRHAHAIAFGRPLGAERRERRRGFLVQHLHRRNLGHRRNEIVGEGAGEELAGLVVDELLVERGGDALHEGAAHLAVGDHRIEQAAGVVHGDVAVDAHLVAQRIDLDAAHVEHEAVGQRGVDAVVARGRLELGRRPHRGFAQAGAMPSAA